MSIPYYLIRLLSYNVCNNVISLLFTVLICNYFNVILKLGKNDNVTRPCNNASFHKGNNSISNVMYTNCNICVKLVFVWHVKNTSKRKVNYMKIFYITTTKHLILIC